MFTDPIVIGLLLVTIFFLVYLPVHIWIERPQPEQQGSNYDNLLIARFFFYILISLTTFAVYTISTYG